MLTGSISVKQILKYPVHSAKDWVSGTHKYLVHSAKDWVGGTHKYPVHSPKDCTSGTIKMEQILFVWH